MKRLRWNVVMGGLAAGLAVLWSVQVSAHVVVQPHEVPPATFQSFTVAVPNERDVAVTSLKLEVPATLQSVLPTAKPGWTITVEKAGGAAVKSITWTGGSIPAELRDDFGFSAKTPSQTSELHWKAYQTYADGQMVAWDANPGKAAAADETATSGPFSVTKVTNPAVPATVTQAAAAARTAARAQTLGIVGVVLGIIGIAKATRTAKPPKG